MTIEFYKEFGELGYLANYSNYGFVKDGIYYKTVEHYYQSEKFDNKELKTKIINAKTPKEASIIGRDRSNKRKDNFKQIKKQVMYNGILEKFRQNRDIAYKLIETRNKDIAEATIDEYYWGIGKDKSGENNIGKILVNVREQIKKEIIDNILQKCINKKIYIIGHDFSDADSIFSSFLLAKILQSKNIDASYALLDTYGDFNSNDISLIEDYIKEKPKIVDNNNLFILVDHNSLNGLDERNVLGAFDHHVLTGEVYDTIEMEYSSTCLLLYDIFKSSYQFSDYEKFLIFLSCLTDTDFLTSSRYTIEDKKLIKELNIKCDVNELQKKYFKMTDFNLSILDNLKQDYKKYEKNFKTIKRSIIKSYSNDFLLHHKEYEEYIKSKTDDYLIIWPCYDKKITNVYYNGDWIKIDKVLTSTILILEILEKKKLL